MIFIWSPTQNTGDGSRSNEVASAERCRTKVEDSSLSFLRPLRARHAGGIRFPGFKPWADILPPPLLRGNEIRGTNIGVESILFRVEFLIAWEGRRTRDRSDIVATEIIVAGVQESGVERWRRTRDNVFPIVSKDPWFILLDCLYRAIGERKLCKTEDDG